MDPAIERFIERMGLEFEADGYPRISGRILGFLITASAPASLDGMANELRVSRASVSTNCRLLEQMGAAHRISIPGDRKDYYELAPGFPERFFAFTRDRTKRKVALAEDALRDLPSEELLARRRMTRWRDFHAFILEELDSVEGRWRDLSASSPDADDRGAGV